MLTTTNDYTCKLNARDWQLYSDHPGRHQAAYSISRAVTNNVRAAKRKLAANSLLSEKKLAYEVQAKVRKVMQTYASSGACDTEPDGVLCDVLEKAFGLPTYSVER